MVFYNSISFSCNSGHLLCDSKKTDVFSLVSFVSSLIFAIIGIAGINRTNDAILPESQIISNESLSSSIIESSNSSSEANISNESNADEGSSDTVSSDYSDLLNKTDNKNDESPIEYGSPFVIVSPQNRITIGNLVRWDTENDRDIFGNTYNTAMKLTTYNLVDAVGGGHSNITADVHMPLGGKGDFSCIISFVVSADMRGNGSSAEVTILADSEELFPSFTINSTSTDRMEYTIDLHDIWDLVFHFECDSVDDGFCIGIVLKDAPEE